MDRLSDADILKFKKQLDASGLTSQQAEQLAISKGMPVTEVQKLRARMQQLGITPASQNAQAGKNEPVTRNNLQDIPYNQNNFADTTAIRPLINPRNLALSFLIIQH